MRRLARLTGLALGVASAIGGLPGCVSMSGLGGGTGYSCKAPEGTSCNSVSGTYANTIEGGSETTSPTEPSGAPARLAALMPRAPQAALGTELRRPGRVLRLWIKPWKDTDDDLVDETRVYVQIDRGEWLIDHLPRARASSQQPVLRPPVSSGSPGAANPEPPARPSSPAPGASTR
jgi:conjugal transfer pilus assembly protein TraV